MMRSKKLSLLFLVCSVATSVSAVETPRAINQLRSNAGVGGIPELKIETPASRVSRAEMLKGEDRYWITVNADNAILRTALNEAGMDIVEINAKNVAGFTDSATLAIIEKAGFVISAQMSSYEYATQWLKDFPAADAAYHNYQETTDALKALVAANPAETSLFVAGKTTEGKDIWCLRINPTEKGETASKKPGAFFVGNHHAREHLSNEVTLGLAEYLLAHKTEPEIKKYIDTLDIYIIPMLNADGAEYDIATGSYKWHRKNTRINPDKSIGVDLNRNYDSLWCQAGASSRPSADTYCGPSAFSEPESQTVKNFVLARKNLKTLMSYHSYSSLILYPWGGKSTPVENTADKNAFMKISQAMAGLTGYTPKQSSALYVATGDTCDWAYAQAGIFAFTTELEGNGFYPGAAIREKAIANNVKAGLYLLSMTDNPYR